MEINLDESDKFLEKKSAKKRKADPNLWKRSIIKVSIMKGEEFFNDQVNTSKVHCPPPPPPCC